MKKLLQKTFFLLLGCILLSLLPSFALASDASLTFADGELTFYTAGNTEPVSDLFSEFKEIMPGDKPDERITIKNESDEFDYIKVYLHAKPKSNTPFLSQLRMIVESGSQEIFNDEASQSGSLSSKVLLGELHQGESLDLRVSLEVPIEMNNNYANQIGEVDWTFTVEGFEDAAPPSADNSMITVRKLWIDDGINRPDSIKVHLLRNGEFHDEVALNQENNWMYTWELEDKHSEWSVVEVNIPHGYESSYSVEGNVTNIINKKTSDSLNPPDSYEPVDLRVVKKWDGKNRNIPESVLITLYDGTTAVESVYLGDWNNWSYTWHNLDGSGNWNVMETNIPKGFVPSYSYKDGAVIVTNSESLIQTGQLKWPVLVLGVLGLLFVLFGLLIVFKKRKQ
ncbi:MAG: Cna B-type domain-containing protein [Coriobacteriia bacterium]|nr:Cna B-type domain-containing protein [Coriobacteriia bacterium]